MRQGRVAGRGALLVAMQAFGAQVGGWPSACSSVCPQSPRWLCHTGGQQLERNGPRRARHHWGRTSGSCGGGSVRGGGRQVGRHHHHSPAGGSCSGGARDGARHPRRGGRRGESLGAGPSRRGMDDKVMVARQSLDEGVLAVEDEGGARRMEAIDCNGCPRRRVQARHAHTPQQQPLPTERRARGRQMRMQLLNHERRRIAFDVHAGDHGSGHM